jgi:hypothetical protein
VKNRTRTNAQNLELLTTRRPDDGLTNATTAPKIRPRGAGKNKGDNEEWSFLCRTEGSVSYVYSPWAEYEDKEFDGGVDQLDLPWTLERRDELISGRANPTEKELRQWREASCRLASNFTDWSHPAWIVPLWPLGQRIEGYALFPCEPDAPWLEGIYESAEEAKVALARIGAVEGTGKWPASLGNP